jgi:polar amino acid transport system substrate-binding protein
MPVMPVMLLLCSRALEGIPSNLLCSGTMKKQIILAAAVVMAAFGVSMQTSSAQTTMSVMPKYGNCEVSGKFGQYKMAPAIAGQFTVQVNLPAPGWYNGDAPELIQDGYEYCMAANIAYRLGLPKLMVQNVAWDALVAGQTREFDMALSQISITSERKKVVDFSTPYFSSDIGVMAKKGMKVDSNSIKTLRIGVQQGTTGESFAMKTLKAKTVRVFPDTPGMFVALQAGQIDVAMTDTAIVLSQAKESGGLFEVVGQYKTGESYGALFPKNSKNKALINTVINNLMKDGTLAKLSKKYLADVWGIDPLSVPYFKK